MFSRMGFFSFGEEKRKANFRNLTVPPNFRFKEKKKTKKKPGDSPLNFLLEKCPRCSAIL